MADKNLYKIELNPLMRILLNLNRWDWIMVLMLMLSHANKKDEIINEDLKMLYAYMVLELMKVLKIPLWWIVAVWKTII